MPQKRPEGESKLLKQAYHNATSRLRRENRPEFDRIYQEEAAALGVEYVPQPTGLDRAREQLHALLTQFPDLKAELG
jgi:hypothetical protein